MKQTQTHEYRMTGAVHLSGEYGEELNLIAREGWRIVHIGAGFIVWERPFDPAALAETAATAGGAQ